MEAILLGILLSLLLQVKKYLMDKWGFEYTKIAIYVGLLVASVVLAAVYRWVPAFYIEEALTIFASSMVFYEVAYKSLLVPLFEKVIKS